MQGIYLLSRIVKAITSRGIPRSDPVISHQVESRCIRLDHSVFNLPTKIEFGRGLLKQAGEIVSSLTFKKRAFIVTDPGIINSGMVGQVTDSFERNGIEWKVFSQVEANPKDEDCEAGGMIVEEYSPDLIIALGGGSVIDSAKAIALLQTHKGRLRDFEGKDKLLREVMPIVAIPTTAGTGSEVTRSAVITDTSRRFKMTIKDVRLAPCLALVDPETTLSLPASLTASTGMDALVHAIEAYTCREANYFSDLFALKAVELIFSSLQKSVLEPSSIRDREALMFGSLLAGIAFSHADVAAVHCMAEAVGGLYDIPHGVGNANFLVPVTAFNMTADPARHAIIGRHAGVVLKNQNDFEAAESLVDALAKLSSEVGIPAFADFSQVDRSDFPSLAYNSFINGSTPSNCRTITNDDYLRIFEETHALR